jgi:hypothetical protein
VAKGARAYALTGVNLVVSRRGAPSVRLDGIVFSWLRWGPSCGRPCGEAPRLSYIRARSPVSFYASPGDRGAVPSWLETRFERGVPRARGTYRR